MVEVCFIRDNEMLIESAAQWFHEKWGVPSEAYRDSMQECARKKAAIPQWYVVKENDKIVAGLGVIENDFHNRKDLTPNVCALYVEEEQRGKGIAGELLHIACEDCKAKGIDTLYLITDHTHFYERYHWSFLCMVQEDDSAKEVRMYIHSAE